MGNKPLYIIFNLTTTQTNNNGMSIEIKIALISDNSVGKTSFISRLSTYKFQSTVIIFIIKLALSYSIQLF